ncbi:MAG: hypothetical protein GTO51_11140 [Candidatus Latescibacteria bacterium]|nr:hypothetical protein [Candidatus Latescibacterota bacterium]NIM66518.1 hypothetical protein [Candidatus Latescibacterota bacterium]NIO02998.1 hypothetical protein [Candidatus Latescibacterota bacterium]NIO30133.1 hypothetical protein [Candidatus Latescibacterota bacterium]NIO57752.1 hypothetical protein [Candidatus Latescibacterota bacterium]
MYPSSRALSKRQLVYLYVASTVPVIGAFILYFFIAIAVLKFMLLGLGLAVLGSVFFAYPKFSFYTAVFYIYSGLSFYFPLLVPYPIVLIAFAAVLLRLFSGEEIELSDRTFIWSAAFFTLMALTSMLYAYSLSVSLIGLIKYVKVLILTFLALQLLKNPADLHKYVVVVFMGGVAGVLLGFANMKLGLGEDISVIGFAQMARFEGTQINPNILAMFLISAIPLGFYAVKRAYRIWHRVFFLVGILILVIATFATFSRSAVFALAFALLAPLFRELKSKRFYVGIALVFAASVFLTPKAYWIRLFSLGELARSRPGDWSILLRIRAAESAIHMFLQHPLTGVGLNNFIARSGTDLVVRIVAHNAYLEILSGVGLFGFLAYVGFCVSAVQNCLKGIRARWEARTAWMGDLSFYILISFIASLISCMFASTEFAYFVWFPLAGGLVAGNLVRRHVAQKES